MKLIDADKLYRKFGVYTEKASMECAKAKNENERMVWECIKEERSNAMRMIRNEPTANRWIPCSERLPEKTDLYLASGKWGSGRKAVDTCEFDIEDGYFNCSWNFTVEAWMELPEPFEVEEE